MGKSLRGKRLKRLGLFWVGVFLSFSLWAQTGVICGTVTDAKIKEPLIGASVVIEGTTVGAITDIDGNFRIENVRPGTYTVAASYVSYQTQTVKDVPVVARQEVVLNIELSDAKLLQKSEMRKNMVMDLIYRGFIYAANYSESHYNPRRSQIKTELRYLFVTTPNR